MSPAASLGAARASLLAVLLTLGAAPVTAAPLVPSEEEAAKRETLGRRLPNAVLLWSNNDRLFTLSFRDFEPQLVTSGFRDTHARWAPDGTELIFCREPGQVIRMRADFTGEEILLPTANLANWTRDGLAIVASDVLDRRRVIRYDVATGEVTDLYHSLDPAFEGGWAAGDRVSHFPIELRPGGERFLLMYSMDRGSNSYVVDLEQHTYITNEQMDASACSPSWGPHGDSVLNTLEADVRPGIRAAFDAVAGTLTPSETFVTIDEICECERFHVHHQRVSNNPEWMVFDAAIFDGPKSDGAREIYVWKIGEPAASAVRITFDTGIDRFASLYVPADECDDEDGDGYGEGESCLAADCDDTDAAVNPEADELCNSKDDDCDQLVDERWPLLGQPCLIGLGVCEANGIYLCAEDGDGLTCPVEPGTPADEVCEGALDEDCDGIIDNGCPCQPGDSSGCYEGPDGSEGVGACAPGVRQCAGGDWGPCEGQALPGVEACDDRIDNDCDGALDGDDADCVDPDAGEEGASACDCAARSGRPSWVLLVSLALVALSRWRRPFRI